MNWEYKDTVIVGKYNYLKKKNVASFDLDDTLIVSNKKDNDILTVTLYHENIIEKLQRYHSLGFGVVIITNQNGIEKGYITKEVFCRRIDDLRSKINIPFMVLASTSNDCYRKPRTKLWDEYIISTGPESFFCGDAGGLPKRKIHGINIKKDFSDTDAKFAYNIGIKFMHRDEFIFNYIPTSTIQIRYGVNFASIAKGPFTQFVKHNGLEIVLMVGYPGSGKSYYAEKYIGYPIVSRDVCKYMKTCLRQCTSYLKEGQSCTIDNINSKSSDREKFIKIAKTFGAYCTVVHITTPKEHSYHNNIWRNCKTGSEIVPLMVYHTMAKYYVAPDKKEGIDRIVDVPFSLETEDENYYKYYY